MPITSDIPSSEIVSSVKLKQLHHEIAIASEVGIETQTTIALRHERRKNTIAMPVSTIASSSVRVTRSICCSVNFDCTLMT
jgi:tRNA(Ser,Leu) C12 N-acetylase TAN1